MIHLWMMSFYLEMVLAAESSELTDDDDEARLAFCLSWVARSVMVHAHLELPALIWNLRLWLSRIWRKRASSTAVGAAGAVEEGILKRCVWGG